MGDSLSAETGTWVGSEPIAYTYEWQACSETEETCTDIKEATGSTYTLTESDTGDAIALVVTASNSASSASETVYAHEIVGAAGPPVNSEAPAIQGTVRVGERVFAGNGQWTGSRPLSYYYQWELCNSSGADCTAIEGATKPSYTITSGDDGSTLRVKVSTRNSLASAGALSEPELVAAAGEASVTEALEVVEATDPSILAPSTTASLESQTVQPALTDAGEEIVSSSTLDSSSVSKETPGEFAVQTADGELSIAPEKTPPDATKTPTIVNGAAALFAETFPATDVLIRPAAAGATALLQLRSAKAPTSFSWEIGIGPTQQLEKLSDGDIAVTEPEPGDRLEESLPKETLGSDEAEAGDTSGEGSNSKAADEELESSLSEEGPFEKLAAAPTTTTPETTPKAGELHPQETKPQYEAATTAMTADRGETANKILMIVKAPTVLDANGETMAATLTVAGDTLTMSLTPTEDSTFPITAALTVASSATSAPAKVSYGLSDPIPADFETAEEEPGKTTTGFDKHLLSGPLEVKVARDVVPYNAAPKGVHTAKFDELVTWLKAVNNAGRTDPEAPTLLEPYVTFEAPKACALEPKKTGSPTEACPPGDDPSIAEYGEDVGFVIKEVMALHEKEPTVVPAVRRWGAWNEPDYHSNRNANPLFKQAKKAALLWKKARQVVNNLACDCTVVAGEFSENDGYVTEYQNAIRRDQESWPHLPRVWGLHDYKDLIEVSSSHPEYDTYAKRFVHSLARGFGHPHIWISEAGVDLTDNFEETSLKNGSEAVNLYRQRLAAHDFLHLHAVSSRYIELVDYYLYRGPSVTANRYQFDSALLHREGVKEEQEPREAYCVIALDMGGCPPSAKTEAPVSNTTGSTAATALMSIDPVGLPTKYFVEYGTTTAYGHTTAPAVVGNENGAQSETVSLTGLEPCTTYHYQAEAENEDDEGIPSLGGDRAFTTHGCGPWVRTLGATSLGEPGVELTGEINPNGNATTFYFEYGPTGSYGYSTPLEEAGSGTAPREVAAIVKVPLEEGGGLKEIEEWPEEEERYDETEREEEEYFSDDLTMHPDLAPCYRSWHYRLVGANATGTHYGGERRINCGF